MKDPRWNIVRARGEGDFVYSVKSTGVYCRPSCPSRRAKPENIAFHADSEAAERAGFRACKRCKPNAGPPHVALVTALCRFIEAADAPPTLATLAKRAGLSRYHLHRVFKAITGLTPQAYGAAHRAKRVRASLGKPHSVTDAIYDAGFNSNGRFYETADAVLGMTPTAFRAGGANTRIRFAVGACSLGAILVAASERGVCAILLGDKPAALLRDLQDRFPRSELIGGDAQFEHLVATVVGFVEAPRLGLALPLDLRGTVFQQRVWRALQQIPAGATVTYTDIAKRIGAPKAVRAVAGACAANAIAVAIPCHRVVRSDGGLSGYRWGIKRKRSLLDREK